MSEKKLLPCMCCGCTAIYKIEEPDEIIDKVPALFCNGCKVIFKVENDSPYLNDDETYKYLEDKTIKAWNTRVPMHKIVERLEEEYKDAQMEYSEAKYQLMEMSEKDSGYISQSYRKDMNEGMCFAFDDAIDIVKEEGGLND